MFILTFHTVSGDPQEVLEHVINGYGIKYQLLLAPNVSEITLKSQWKLTHSEIGN